MPPSIEGRCPSGFEAEALACNGSKKPMMPKKIHANEKLAISIRNVLFGIFGAQCMSVSFMYPGKIYTGFTPPIASAGKVGFDQQAQHLQ
jgi:hypothetical protein